MKNIEQLEMIMRTLRDPDTGCPWDLQQDFNSIAAWTLEEAYEVLDAINREQPQQLCEELGDLLFQVVYHAQMANEQGQFDFSDVIDGINDKLIRRHPHVFAGEEVNTADEQSQRWQQIKNGEDKSESDSKTTSFLDEVATSQPAMRRAEKLQLKAATVGFDWDSVPPVFRKVQEELAELEQEIKTNTDNKEAIVEEYGDLLFVMINLARKLAVNPELALAQANSKFIRRFNYIEEKLSEQKITLEQANLEQMDTLWDEAKLKEKDD